MILDRRWGSEETVWHIVCYALLYEHSETIIHPYHLEGEQVIFPRSA